jgi:hypothetical protein
MIDLSKSQCKNLADFIEFNIFEVIRKDEDIDNPDWLIDMMEAYQKLRAGEKVRIK